MKNSRPSRLLLSILVATGLALPSASHADVRKWTDTKGVSVEADFVKQDDSTVTVKLKNGKEVPIPKARLSAADLEFLKTQSGGGTTPGSGSATPPAKDVSFDKVKIDKRGWTRKVEKLDISSVDLAVQLQTEHFHIAGTTKVKPDLVDAYGESLERLYVHLTRAMPGMAAVFKDRRMLILITEDTKTHEALMKNLDSKGFNQGGPGAICYMNTDDAFQEAHKVLQRGRVFFAGDNVGKQKNMKWQQRIHFVVSDLWDEYLGDLKQENDYSFSLIDLSVSYYFEYDISGDIETKVSFGMFGGNVEGFKNGRAWGATVKNLLKSPANRPGIEKLLKTPAQKSEPIDIGSGFGMVQWIFRNPARLAKFNELLEFAKKEGKVIPPLEFVKTMGFESTESFDKEWTTFMNSPEFK